MRRRVLGVPIIILLIVGLLTVGGVAYAVAQYVVEIQNRLTVIDPPEESCTVGVGLGDGSEVSYVLDWGTLENGNRTGGIHRSEDKQFLIENLDPNWPAEVTISTDIESSIGYALIAGWYTNPSSSPSAWSDLEDNNSHIIHSGYSDYVWLMIVLNPDCPAGDYDFAITFSAEVVQ